MTLGCPLRDEWYPGKPCGLKVRGRLSENGVTVLSVNDNHTCSSEHRAKKTQRARDALKARIDRLREEINEGQSTVEDEEEQEKQVTYTSRAGAKSRESVRFVAFAISLFPKLHLTLYLLPLSSLLSPAWAIQAMSIRTLKCSRLLLVPS